VTTWKEGEDKVGIQNKVQGGFIQKKGFARSILAPVEKNTTSKTNLGVSSPLHKLVYLWSTLPALQIRAAVVPGGWNLYLLVLL
jgi:hypothetical protein